MIKEDNLGDPNKLDWTFHEADSLFFQELQNRLEEEKVL